MSWFGAAIRHLFEALVQLLVPRGLAQTGASSGFPGAILYRRGPKTVTKGAP